VRYVRLWVQTVVLKGGGALRGEVRGMKVVGGGQGVAAEDVVGGHEVIGACCARDQRTVYTNASSEPTVLF
jgi:hypothetical protein